MAAFESLYTSHPSPMLTWLGVACSCNMIPCYHWRSLHLPDDIATLASPVACPVQRHKVCSVQNQYWRFGTAVPYMGLSRGRLELHIECTYMYSGVYCGLLLLWGTVSINVWFTINCSWLQVCKYLLHIDIGSAEVVSILLRTCRIYL